MQKRYEQGVSKLPDVSRSVGKARAVERACAYVKIVIS